MENLKGYEYGSKNLETSPITLKDLELLKKTLLWSEEDEKNLKVAGDILKDQIEEILDLWYEYVGSNEHLVYFFTDGTKPIENYLMSVRARFGQWIKDICYRNYDQDWLNYQYEIAKRHHRIKKNQIDGVNSVPFVNFRYLVAFIFPITVTIKSFLAKGNINPQELEAIYNSWFKAIVLTVTLWCYPYVRSEDF